MPIILPPPFSPSRDAEIHLHFPPQSSVYHLMLSVIFSTLNQMHLVEPLQTGCHVMFHQTPILTRHCGFLYSFTQT